MELPYKEVYTMNPTEARKRIVQTYYQTGSKGARPCALTTTSVFILGMEWRVGRRMSVVWRWDLRVRHMWV